MRIFSVLPIKLNANEWTRIKLHINSKYSISIEKDEARCATNFQKKLPEHNYYK